MDTKHALASKTVWVQIVAVLSLLVPVVRDWLASNPVEFVAVLAAVNVIVRFITRGKISVFAAGNAAEEKTAGGSGGLPLLIVWGTAAGLCFTALPSCSALAGLPIKFTAQLEEGALSYSSKGGLQMEYRPGYGEMPEVYRKSAK
jgi:hypothetical protein